MDILVSSNLERLLYLLSGEDGDYVKGLMQSLSETGEYTVTDEIFRALQQDFRAGFTDNVETGDTIREVFEKTGYLLDPHTAVAWHVATEILSEEEEKIPNVVLSTASPYKFPKDVLNALGEPAIEDPFEVMARLEERTKVPAPKNLSGLRDREVRFKDVSDRDALYDYVMKEILK